jgi:hypothetical protein
LTVAVKTFTIVDESDEERNFKYFSHEQKVLSRLKKVDGVIEYIGNYSVYEKRGSRMYKTHNLILEYGDQDLDEYLLDPDICPPVHMKEIGVFYNRVFTIAQALKEIHTLDIEDEKWAGYG